MPGEERTFKSTRGLGAGLTRNGLYSENIMYSSILECIYYFMSYCNFIAKVYTRGLAAGLTRNYTLKAI